MHTDASPTDRTDALADTGRCRATAKRTGNRCQNAALAHLPYCADHIHRLEAGATEAEKQSS